jgi:hypothetical protein
MRFSTIFSVLACGAMTLAIPIASNSALVSRGKGHDGSSSGDGSGSILDIVGGLSETVHSLLNGLSACEDSVCIDGVFTTVVDEVDAVTAIVTGVAGDLSSDLSTLLGTLLADVVSDIHSHKSSCSGSTLTAVDTAFTSLLTTLGGVVDGLLAAVFGVVDNLVGDLEGVLTIIPLDGVSSLLASVTSTASGLLGIL